MGDSVAVQGRRFAAGVLSAQLLDLEDGPGPLSALTGRTVSGRTVHIRVSTRTSGTWQSNKKWRDGTADRAPNRLWAFVTLAAASTRPAELLLTYEADVRRDIDADVLGWARRNGYTEPPVLNSGHCAITEARVKAFATPIEDLLR